MATNNKFLTTKEVAEILGVSRCTIYRWCKRGWLVRIVLPNKTFRIVRASLDKAMSGR